MAHNLFRKAILMAHTACLDSAAYQKCSKRSFLALQIGQTPGGFSRAQRYPQTLQRQTGRVGTSPGCSGARAG
jgi:hypothetical protein